jgi:hypothetical protein
MLTSRVSLSAPIMQALARRPSPPVLDSCFNPWAYWLAHRSVKPALPLLGQQELVVCYRPCHSDV